MQCSICSVITFASAMNEAYCLFYHWLCFMLLLCGKGGTAHLPE